MAHTGTVADADDSNHDHAQVLVDSLRVQTELQHPDCAPEVVEAPAGLIVRTPRTLLYSERRGPLAVWAWGMYATLMPNAIEGGTLPGRARRVFLAERAGCDESAIDRARAELLAEDEHGVFLWRSAPRGCKRSVLHRALQMPRRQRVLGDPGWVPVPAWSFNLVWAGRKRPEGRISPTGWRFYGVLVDRATKGSEDGLTPKPFEMTVKSLGEGLGKDAATGRRALAELERAGMVEVTQRSGAHLGVRVVVDAEEAARVAQAYAEHGRKVSAPRVHPLQNRGLTPCRIADSPLAESRTPLECAPKDLAVEECAPLPAGDHHDPLAREPQAAPRAGKSKTSATRSVRPKRVRAVRRESIEVYRALPREVAAKVSEHGSARVLTAIGAELEHRTMPEMVARIAANWEHWRYRLNGPDHDQLADATGLAIRMVRRGLDCRDVRCENGWSLDLGAACKACAEYRPDAADVDQDEGPDAQTVLDAMIAAARRAGLIDDQAAG